MFFTCKGSGEEAYDNGSVLNPMQALNTEKQKKYIMMMSNDEDEKEKNDDDYQVEDDFDYVTMKVILIQQFFAMRRIGYFGECEIHSWRCRFDSLLESLHHEKQKPNDQINQVKVEKTVNEMVILCDQISEANVSLLYMILECMFILPIVINLWIANEHLPLLNDKKQKIHHMEQISAYLVYHAAIHLDDSYQFSCYGIHSVLCRFGYTNKKITKDEFQQRYLRFSTVFQVCQLGKFTDIIKTRLELFSDKDPSITLNTYMWYYVSQPVMDPYVAYLTIKEHPLPINWSKILTLENKYHDLALAKRLIKGGGNMYDYRTHYLHQSIFLYELGFLTLTKLERMIKKRVTPKPPEPTQPTKPPEEKKEEPLHSLLSPPSSTIPSLPSMLLSQHPGPLSIVSISTTSSSSVLFRVVCSPISTKSSWSSC